VYSVIFGGKSKTCSVCKEFRSEGFHSVILEESYFDINPDEIS